MNLAQSTLIMSGGSRGIGEAIAIKAARDGANIALLAKTTEPHPALPGTIYTAAQAIEAAGGNALPLVGDIRDDEFVETAVAQTAEQFGGIDIVVNNASAIDLSRTEDVTMKKYDLMTQINARGAFLLSKLCIPHLRRSPNPHILTLSPPLLTDSKWFGTFTAYTIAKYGMSLVTAGLAEELRADGIAANSLWPRTAIDTAAVRNVVGAGLEKHSRTVDIMADAAYWVITQESTQVTGNFFIDDDVLEAAGVTDFSVYLNGGADADLALDFWVEAKGEVGSNPSLRL